MSTITASDVKQLRELTGAGMMDCKAALSEAQGNMDEAIAILRKKGQKLSEKRADRDAKEGVVLALVSEDKTKGVVIKLSCETDFVAKNEAFIALTKSFAEAALKEFPATTEALLALPYHDVTIGGKITEQIGVIGEKLEISSYERLEATQVAPYIHMGNKAGVLVGLNKQGDEVYEAGRAVAMQVAAMHPIAVDKDEVDATIVAQEIEIGREMARQEGKPEQMLDKIAEGRLNKFYKEKTLLNQQFVRDNKKSVQEFLNEVDKGLTVTGFKHVALG